MHDMVDINRPMKASGKVTLEYISKDGKSSGVKSDNMAFNHAWNSTLMISGFLRTSGYSPHLILTDYSGDVNPLFPIIPGNTVGYCIFGEGSSGLYKGAEITSKRDISISTDNKMTYKRVFEFTGSQVPGEVKTIGYSCQWMGTKADLTNNRFYGYKLPYYRNIYSEYDYDNGIFNTITDKFVKKGDTSSFSNGVITFTISERDLHGSLTTHTLSHTVDDAKSGSIVQRVVVLDVDTGKYYCIMDVGLTSISPNILMRYFFEISDDFNSVSLYKKIPLHSGSSFDSNSSEWYIHYIYPYASALRIQHNGYKKGAKYYFGPTSNTTTNKEYEILLEEEHVGEKTQKDFIRNLDFQKIRGEDSTISGGAPSSTSYYLGNSLIAVRGLLGYLHGLMFFDLNNPDIPMGSIYPLNSQSSTLSGIRVENYENTDSELIASYCNTGFKEDDIFRRNYCESVGALTWFRVPDDAPKREEGDGIRITYEMTFTPV